MHFLPSPVIYRCILEKLTGIPSLAVDTFERLAGKGKVMFNQYKTENFLHQY